MMTLSVATNEPTAEKLKTLYQNTLGARAKSTLDVYFSVQTWSEISEQVQWEKKANVKPYQFNEAFVAQSVVPEIKEFFEKALTILGREQARSSLSMPLGFEITVSDTPSPLCK